MFKPGVLFAVAFVSLLTAPSPGSSGAEARALPIRLAQLKTMPPSGEQDMVSWVVLADTYVALTVDSLREKLDELYPGQFLPPRQKGNFVVGGPMPGQFLIHSSVSGAAGTFLLNSAPKPYTEFSSFAKAIADRTLRRQAEAQRCWLSVDLIGKHATDEDAYRFIEQVLAKLAPADAAFLVHPSKLITMTFNDELRVRLASGEKILPSP